MNIYEKMINYSFKEMSKNKVFYHNKNHVADLLCRANELLKGDRFAFINKDEIILKEIKHKLLNDKVLNMPLSLFIAIVFHDIVYDVSFKENEENSASKMYSYVCENMKTIMYERQYEIDLAYEMILSTKEHSIPKRLNISEYEKLLFSLMLDVDMFTFAKDYKEFKRESKLIEKEYRLIYSEFEFNFGRKKFLKSMLDRKIYLLKELSQFENQAKNNIKRFIEEELTN